MNKNELIVPDEIMQQLPCGIVSFLDDGTIQTINNSLIHLLGYSSPSDLHHAKVEALLSLASRIFYQTHLFPLLKLKGKVEEIFLSLKTNDASQIPVLLFCNRIETEGQWLNIGVVVPVWQRKKYEDEILKAKEEAIKVALENAELIQVQQELESNTKLLDKQIVRLTHINEDYKEFSKVIAHDLQEPIRKISIFTNLIKQYLLNVGGKVEMYVDKIKDSVLRLSQLTQSLGLYVEVDTSQESLQTILLPEIITIGAEKAMQEIQFTELELEISDLPEVKGYSDQIRQLFYQLIKNSIQFRDPKRKLKISVTGVIAQYNNFRAHGNRYKYVDFAKIEFRDNARGFNNIFANQVFKMFNRLEKDTPGLGFGLALAKKIVDNHLGMISCNSQPGSGTIITILLPL